MRSVLDTSVLIGSALDLHEGEFTISVVSITELQFGVLIAPSESQRAHRLARLSAITRTFEPLPVDSSVASSYAEIAAATYRAKRKSSARSLDLMIAATAHAHNARLVTRNIKDVKHLDHILEIVEIR
jgi:predicted nucleic acid-binding protein